MNWYKRSQSDFADRNTINDQIDSLKLITVTLDKLAKLVFQTQAGTKQVLREVLEAKTLSTYPAIQQMVEHAVEICMDSPHKAADLCKHASAQIVTRVAKLEKQRKQLIHKTMPDRWKGWRD